MSLLRTRGEFIEQAQISLAAAEEARRTSSEIDPMVEYHLRRAEIFAQLALSVPARS